jgi:hypothetical protein
MRHRESLRNIDKVKLGTGASLEGDELEDYCKRRGLCPLCAKTRTRKRNFKLFKRNKWELLTVLNKEGAYKVYKGYCVKPNCFTLHQAKRLAGDPVTNNSRRPNLPRKNSRSKPSWVDNNNANNDSDDDSNHHAMMHGNQAAHKRSKEAFPPPELRNAANFVVKDNEPLFVVHKAVEGLEQNSNTIAVLELSGIGMRKIDFEALAEGLKVNTTLHSLILENSQLDDDNLGIIASGLGEAKDIPLVKLYLRSNQVGDPGVAALGPFLQANSTLEKLDLSRNCVSSNGALALFSAFIHNRVTRIRSINLSHNTLWDLEDDEAGIEPFLQKNRSLRILNLEGNNLNDESIHALSYGIKHNDYTALERLYLGWNAIGDEGTIALAEMLEVNTSLRVLGLGENLIQNAGARAVLAAMDQNTTITEISGLWRNKIDRRFIVVAIRKLLLATERGDSIRAKLYEQAPSNNVGRMSSEIISEFEGMPEASSGFMEGSGTVVSAMTANDASSVTEEDHHPLRRGRKPTHVVRKQMVSTRQEEPIDFATPTVIYSTPPTDAPSYDRLVIFQSTPLASLDRESGANQAVPLFDSDHESRLVQESLGHVIAGEIDTEVEVATVHRFSAFFKQSLAHVLHISCSSPKNQLTLENGYGSIHTIPKDELKRLVASTRGSLRVVFVSSRNAKSIGQVFVDAGVPHVVCCELDHRYQDLIGMDFVQTFYRSLAEKKMLKHAFQIARAAASTSPQARFIRRVYDRFRLLPERAENDPYHNVPVFFAQPVPPKSAYPLNDDYIMQGTNQLRVPPIPANFSGREIDMYDILGAIRVDDIVRIAGPPGVGKDSVMSAVCHYVWKRRTTFELDNIFWLPAPVGVVPEEDSLYGDLCLCTDILKNAETKVWDEDDTLLESRERIEIEAEETQLLLILDCRPFQNKAAQDGLEKFVSFLLNAAQAKIILIETRNSSDMMSAVSLMSRETTGDRFDEATIELHPLDFKSTAQLFGESSKFITSSLCPAAHNAIEFAELLEPPSIRELDTSSMIMPQRRSELYARMGHGLPGAIATAANVMDTREFIQMIGIANRPEVFVDSLGALDIEVRRRRQQQSQAFDDKNYLRAFHLDDLMQELEAMRPEFPNLEEMKEEEELMKADLAEAVSNRRYDVANDMKRDLLALKKKIIKEQRSLNAAKSSNNGKSSSANAQMNSLEAKVQKMVKSSKEVDDDMEVPSFIGGAETTADMGEITFAVTCGEHRDCSFVVSTGNVWEFDHPAEARGIVCWTNECCYLEGTVMGNPLLRLGGSDLRYDLSELPTVSKTPYGPVRCAMGNAVMMGPAQFCTLDSPCIILTVGPFSPSIAATSSKAGKNGEEEELVLNSDFLEEAKTVLRSCYRSSMVLAKHSELQVLALSLSTSPDSSLSYAETLRVGLETLVAEVQFSHLRDLHLVAQNIGEASLIADMLQEMGHRQI